MVKAILGMLIMLLASFPAAAQMSSGYVYAFGGPVVVPKSAFTRWNGDFVHAGPPLQRPSPSVRPTQM